MFSVLFWCLYCLYFVFVYGDLRLVNLPVYTPPSQEELLSTYFKNSEQVETNRTKKSILSGSDNFHKTVENMKKELSVNISNLEKELNKKNVTEMGTSINISGPMQDYIRSGVFKNFLALPVEPTTYRYPTAVWSSQNYEKLKNSYKFRPRNITKIYPVRPIINPAYVPLDRNFNFVTPEKIQKRNRGKTKWKDVSKSFETPLVTAGVSEGSETDKQNFVDRFLEQSLSKYLTSSNLRENVGNVSVKTFSDLLKNITDQKPKKLQSPYDENKELRMKFREEVILKKKNETKPTGRFLDKQLQKRLEKVQDMFNEKDKEKILANMWKYTPLNRTSDVVDEKRNRTINVTDEIVFNNTAILDPVTEEATPLYNSSLIYFTTESSRTTFRHSTEHLRGTAKYQRSKYEVTDKVPEYGSYKKSGSNGNLLKAEETAYYRKGQFPSLTFIGQPEKPGVIPGRPLVDYPVHSFPPATKFKCPKFKGETPKMMADPETRCQVFYICTGDGPTTAMLCPNGTMFNEKFLVCDWWYNVNC